MGTARNIQFQFTDHILLIDHIVLLPEGDNKQVGKGSCGGRQREIWNFLTSNLPPLEWQGSVTRPSTSVSVYTLSPKQWPWCHHSAVLCPSLSLEAEKGTEPLFCLLKEALKQVCFMV